MITTTRFGELSLSAQAGLNGVPYLTDANGWLLASDTGGDATGRGGYLLEPSSTGR